MNTVLKRETVNLSQFEITSDLLRNLYKFNLTPVTKLVLLELTTHLNESKNGSVVFPSVDYIAEVLGIGLTATKKAISDLIKEGFIIKTKRNNVKGNFNKYLLTSKITGLKNNDTNILSQQGIKMRNSTSERSENELFKRSDSDLFLLRTNKPKQIEQQTVRGENVYSGDDAILYDYAKKRANKSVDAYIKKLKESKSAEKIIAEYKKKTPAFCFKQTDLLRQKRKTEKQERQQPENCTAWVELGKKFGIK